MKGHSLGNIVHNLLRLGQRILQKPLGKRHFLLAFLFPCELLAFEAQHTCVWLTCSSWKLQIPFAFLLLHSTNQIDWQLRNNFRTRENKTENVNRKYTSIKTVGCTKQFSDTRWAHNQSWMLEHCPLGLKGWCGSAGLFFISFHSICYLLARWLSVFILFYVHEMNLMICPTASICNLPEF